MTTLTNRMDISLCHTCAAQHTRTFRRQLELSIVPPSEPLFILPPQERLSSRAAPWADQTGLDCLGNA